MHYFKALIPLLCVCCLTGLAQDSTKGIPLAYLQQASARLEGLSQKLDQKTQKALAQIEKGDQKIYKKLLRKDSTKAAQFFSQSKQKYEALKQKLKGVAAPPAYSAYLDTLKTSIQFLSSNPALLASIKGSKEATEALSKVKEWEGALGKGESLKTFLQERKTYLREHLGNLPFTKELKNLNKRAYYYSAQIKEYEEMLKDKKKLERKAMELLSKNKAFQDFMKKNSGLASLFRMPGSEDGSGGPSLQGLQTRAQVSSLVQGRIAAGGPNAGDQVRANLQAARAQLAQFKDKAVKFGGGSSDIYMPDFTPNDQKTKSFFKRVEVGTNLQTQKAKHYFPVTSDLGLSLGYKLNDRSIVGVGASYKLGLGTGWNNIAISHQGAGFRSFVDYKLKGSLFVSGGYEQNYRAVFNSIQALADYSAWQNSGLIGISKKYKAGNKLKGNMQLLWDFMSYQQVPRTDAIIFRVGYSFK